MSEADGVLQSFGASVPNSRTEAQKHSSTVGIVIATCWEARPLLSRFHFVKIEKNLYQAEITGRRVLLRVSGVGEAAAREAASDLCRRGVGELISAGFCGALVPSLSVGDLVTERIASVSSPVRTPAERRALTQRANAVAVDMETQAIVEVGTRRGVPIHVLRVVSDLMDDDLTPLFGCDQGFSALRIAVRLVNPGVWPLAGRLRRHSAIAGARLADALDAYLHAAV